MPLFLYALYPFYLLGGSNFASIPIILADAGTAAIVYLIVERSAGERLGLAAGLAYAFSPFVLYYEAYAWFSSQPMTFFAILGMYYLVRDKPVKSLAALAIGVVFKQQVIFLLPVFVVWLARKHSRRLFVGLSAFSGIVVGVSLPFLVISARDYLSLVSYGILGKWPGTVAAQPPLSTAVCQNIYSNLMGTSMSCTFGTTTYFQFVTNAPPAVVLLDRVAYAMNFVSTIVLIPLFLLVIPVLFVLRKNPQFLTVVSTYSAVAFLIVFSLIFHPALKYYYVPVYALLFACVANRGSFIVAAVAPVLSLLTPSGAFQELLPLLAILATAVLLDERTIDVGSSQSPLKTRSSEKYGSGAWSKCLNWNCQKRGMTGIGTYSGRE